MACGTVDCTGVCGIPGGVVIVSVFDGVDGVVAALVDMAVVAVNTAVVAVFGACLDNAVVGETCGVGTVAAEAESSVAECENRFGEGAVVNPAGVVAVVISTARV